MSKRDRAHALQGTRAGFVSRVVAAIIDVTLVLLVLIASEAIFAAVRFLLGDEPFEFPDVGTAANSSLLLLLLVVVLAIAWSGSGRTIGNNLVGLRVVMNDGRPVAGTRALVRALIVVALPVLAMGWILVSKRNAGIHDLVCRTAVVYDWRARRARAVPAEESSRRDG